MRKQQQQQRRPQRPQQPHRQHAPQRLPPLDRDPWELRASIKARIAQQRANAALTIALWIEINLVALYDLHKVYKLTSFYEYVKADYGMSSHAYIDRCLAVATLNPADYEGCILPVEALVVVARALGPQTRAMLIAITREANLDGSVVLQACRRVRRLADPEAAVLLHRYLVLEVKIPKDSKEEEGAEEEEEEKDEKEETLEGLGKQLLEQCWYFAGLMWDVIERKEIGQKMSAELARKLYARMRAMPQLILDTAELVLLPEGRTAPEMASVVEEGERRQARRAEGRGAEGAATPQSEGEGGGVDRQAHHERSGGVATDSAPKSSTDPEPVVRPKPVVEPAVVQDPAVVPEPTTVQEPAVVPTVESAVVQDPAVVPEPTMMQEPAVVPEPVVAVDPVVAVASETSVNPEPTSAPEPASDSEPTVAPEPTSAPEPAAAPPSTPEPVGLPSARRPEPWSRDAIVFPVLYPSDIPEVPDFIAGGPPLAPAIPVTASSPADRAACALITVCHQATAATVDALEYQTPLAPVKIHPVLAAKTTRAAMSIKDCYDVLQPMIDDTATVGLALLEPRYRQHAAGLAEPSYIPGTTAGRLLSAKLAAGRSLTAPIPKPIDDLEGWTPCWPLQPLPSVGGAPAVPPIDAPILQWLTAHCPDPICQPEPEPAEKPLWYFLGLAETFKEQVITLAVALQEAEEGRAPPLNPVLAAELRVLLGELSFQCGGLKIALASLSQVGFVREEAEAEAAAARRALSDARVVVLGESQRPALYLKIGYDNLGRQIAITAETPQLILIFGSTGWGKTYLMRVMAEGALLNLPGINTLTLPQRTAQFEMDYNKGSTRRQMLEGFAPNDCQAQLQLLADWYGYRARGNEAYTRGTLLCLPGAEKELKLQYAALQERGLVIRPALIHPSELGLTGYRALLSNARGGQSDRPAYLDTVEAMISHLGPTMTPQDLIDEIKAKGIDPRVDGKLIRQLELMRDLVKDDGYLIDVFNEPHPVFVLLESRFLSPDLILPYQICMVNALKRPLRDGRDPHRWLYLDEINKMTQNAVVEEVMTETAQEIRHTRATLTGNGQRPSGVSGNIMGLSTINVVFRTTARREIRLIKDRCALFENVPDEEFMNLGHGECLIAALRSTDQTHVVLRVRVRPTVTRAGGETLRTTEG